MARSGCTALSLALLASTSAGCLLFNDPVNTPPKVSITCAQDQGSGVIITCPTDQPQPAFVRMKIKFQAVASDPDQSIGSLRFDWYTGTSCNAARANPPAASPADLVTFPLQPDKLGLGCVVVDVTDSRGAMATASQAFTIVDRAPTAAIAVSSASTGATLPADGQPLRLPLFGKATLTGKGSEDPDADPLDYRWSVLSGDIELSMPGCPDPSQEPYLCTFTTATPGTYRVKLVVADSVKESAPVSQTIQVAEDQLPNIVLDLVQPAPPFPPDEPELQLLASLPNTFRVVKVEDDGDPYPTTDLANPYPTPPAGFIWSYQGSDDSLFHRLIGETEASFTIRPNTFGAQERIRLRVEYHDRVTACSSPACRAVFNACNQSAIVCYSSDQRAQWVVWSVVFR